MSLQLIWPDRPVCHDHDPWAQQFAAPHWERRESSGRRHCSYCGSLHPQEVLVGFLQGAKLDLADMKYGWPHKFYVTGLPNPHAGEPEKIFMHGKPREGESLEGWEEYEDGYDERTGAPVIGQRKLLSIQPQPRTLTLKFYTNHLYCLALDTFKAVSERIREHSNIQIERRPGGFAWKRG